MKLKLGYKQTEIGLIPEEWGVLTISTASRKIMDYRGRTPKKLGLDWGGGDIPALSAANVKMGYIDFAQECYLASNDLYHRWMVHGDVEKDDIVFTTEAPLGNVALIPDSKKYVLSQRTILLQTNKRTTHSPFLYHYLMSESFQRTLYDNASGSTAQGIKRKVFETLATISPPLEEQEAIASALGDADALIELLDQLITKKRQIKQGAMQELLTGKRRLPGFSGEWEVKRLADLADIRSGGTPSTAQPQFWDGGVKWCTPTDITALDGFKYLSNTARTISAEGLKASSAEIIPKHSIVMTSRATIGECAINTVPMTTNQGFKNFVPFDSVDTEFLYYLLTTQRAGFIGLCSGSTFLEIGKTQLSGYQVQVPKTKPEQTAIATILSDMDTELAALESRLAKARQIKQGMMQELLTGRIRLL